MILFVSHYMRMLLLILLAIVLILGAVCYELGYHSGVKRSRSEEDQRGLVVLTLVGYKQVEATNWPKVKSLLATEIVGFTRDYERRFGAPSGTNDFVLRFQEAKSLADRIEREMVPVSAVGQMLRSNAATNSAK